MDNTATKKTRAGRPKSATPSRIEPGSSHTPPHDPKRHAIEVHALNVTATNILKTDAKGSRHNTAKLLATAFNVSIKTAHSWFATPADPNTPKSSSAYRPTPPAIFDTATAFIEPNTPRLIYAGAGRDVFFTDPNQAHAECGTVMYIAAVAPAQAVTEGNYPIRTMYAVHGEPEKIYATLEELLAQHPNGENLLIKELQLVHTTPYCLPAIA